MREDISNCVVRDRSLRLGLTLALALIVLAGLLAILPAKVTQADSYTVINTYDSGPGSLRQAIADADNGDTILFDASLNGQTIVLTTGELLITETLTIAGPGADQLAISGNGSSRVFHIQSGASVTITGVTVRDGDVGALDGGGILSSGASTLTLKSCVVYSNTAQNAAGIYSDSSSGILVLDSCTVYSNTAADHAAGVVSFGTLTVTDSTIYSNTAGTANGGGVYVDEGLATLVGTTVSGNRAGNTGGGIWNGGDSTLTLNSSPVFNNRAANGGGIFNDGGTLTANGSAVYSNTASSQGGGVLNQASGTLTLNNCGVYSNTASVNGGGIFNQASGTLILNNCSVYSNTAQNTAGIYNGGAGSALVLNNCAVYRNAAADNVAGIGSFGTLTVTRSVIYSNTAGAMSGGGVGVGAGLATLINCTVSGNSAGGGGGGVYNMAGTLNLVNVTIAGNAADSNGSAAPLVRGGGLAIDAGTVNVTNTIIARNRTYTNPNDCYCVGPLTSGGYNLVENDAPPTCFFTATGDVTGTNPLLGPLADNGGATWTRALLPGSPALNKIPSGSNGCGTTLTADQRGVLRPQPPGGACDVGAFEARPPILSLDKTVGVGGPAFAGQRVVYAVAIGNGGDLPATGALVSDTLPPSLTLAGPVMLYPPGVPLPAPAWPVLASGLTISHGRRITLTFPVTVNTGLAEGTLTNTAAVTSSQTPVPVLGSVPLAFAPRRVYLPLVVRNS
jgi:hypothetical protein